MCPMCITTAVLIAGGVATTGGLAAFVMKKASAKDAVENHCAPIHHDRRQDGASAATPAL